MLSGWIDEYITKYEINIELTKWFELNNTTEVLWVRLFRYDSKAIHPNYDLSYL